MAVRSVVGRMQEFDPKREDITTYLERLDLYFQANSVEDNKKVGSSDLSGTSNIN